VVLDVKVGTKCGEKKKRKLVRRKSSKGPREEKKRAEREYHWEYKVELAYAWASFGWSIQALKLYRRIASLFIIGHWYRVNVR
jgi:hypothetical protein